MRFLFLFPLLLAVACSPKTQLFVADANDKPALQASTFKAVDAVELPYRSWLPARKPKTVIVAVHGFNDYSHGFEDAAKYFSAHGIAVYAYDQRGFGASPQTGIWAGEENLTRDLKNYVAVVARRYPHTPLYVMGESMGGAVVVAALADGGIPGARGVILLAPALWGGDSLPFYDRAAVWSVAHTLPFYGLTGEGLNVLASDNIPMLRKLSADPLIIKKTRVDAIYGLVHLMDHSYDDVADVKTPVLLLYGACDQVIPAKAIRHSLPHFTAPLTFVYYPEGYHMLTRDLQAKRVIGDIESWVLRPGKTLPSGFQRDGWPVDNSGKKPDCRTLK